jgi:PST family polysaccharide transporter
MDLLRTASLNSLAVAARLLSALALNKLLAVTIGPAGYMVVGQFQNVVSLTLNLSGGLLTNGVVQQTAQHHQEPARQHQVWSAAFGLALVVCTISGLALCLWGAALAPMLLHSADLGHAFVWAGLALPAMAANLLLLSIVNGKKEVGIYVGASVASSLTSVLLMAGLATAFGLRGALLAFVLNPALALAITALLVTRRDWFRTRYFFQRPSGEALQQLKGFGLMGLTTALVAPLTYIAVRSLLADRFGMSGAGQWQAMWKISELSTSLATATLSLYYLPRIAELASGHQLRKEIMQLYRLLLPLLLACALAIYLLRDFIIRVLFTEEFLPMRELFAWQVAGDVLKLGGWVLAFVMLGRAMTRAYVLTELIFHASFIGLAWWLTLSEGLRGVSMAYAINCLLYWITMLFLIGSEIRGMDVAPRRAGRPALETGAPRV